MNVWDAQVIVARQLMHNAIDDMNWEDMPDIGESDWLAVIDNCRVMACEPRDFDKAIGLLETRAKAYNPETKMSLADLDMRDRNLGGQI